MSSKGCNITLRKGERVFKLERKTVILVLASPYLISYSFAVKRNELIYLSLHKYVGYYVSLMDSVKKFSLDLINYN